MIREFIKRVLKCQKLLWKCSVCNQRETEKVKGGVQFVSTLCYHNTPRTNFCETLKFTVQMTILLNAVSHYFISIFWARGIIQNALNNMCTKL